MMLSDMLPRQYHERDLDEIRERHEREIAMRPKNSNPGERDRVGRILARQSRVAARVSRQFTDPDSALAREVMDILARMPEAHTHRGIDR